VKNAFKFPMLKSERIAGLLYLAVHACVLPWLVVYVYTDILRNMDVVLTGANLNLIYYVVSFAFVMIFMFRYLKTSFSDLVDNPLGSLKAVILAYMFNYAALTLVSLFLSAVLVNVANPNSQEIVNQTKLDPNAVIVVAVLLVPVVEESLFRGALFGTLRTRSRLAAYIVSAALFSVYHLWQYFLGGFEWHMLLYLLQYIPASLALCWCYEKSGSIWAPIILHAAINFISIRVTLG
jgi:membrane protease YdiL (CAAX protease family)